MTTGRRTALITGASGGIGAAIAERLAAEEFDLTITGRSHERLEQLAEGLRSHSGDVEVVSADLGNEDGLNAVADAHTTRFGSLDLLVICAGTGSAAPLANYPIRRFDRQFEINVRAPFLLFQRLLPALRAAAVGRTLGSRVVAIASITGVVAETDLGIYGSSKAALIALCESICAEEGENGVSATAIAPGYVNTEMSDWVTDRIDRDKMIGTNDIVELVSALTRMSRWAAVPAIVVTRPGPHLWRA